MNKLCCLTLALLMLLPLVSSCGERTTEEKEAVSPTGGSDVSSADLPAPGEEETEEPVFTRENVPDTLPGDLNFDGKTCTIFYSNGRGKYKTVEGGEELTGEVVNDAVFNCNRGVAERLNVDLQFFAENRGNWDTIAGLISALVMAADSTYDVYQGEQYGIAQTVVSGFYHNAFELPYLDFSQPWWNSVFMDNLQFTADSRFLLTGDFDLTTLSEMWVQYYNRSIYEKQFGDPDGLYDLVLEGKWTIDKMIELVDAGYLDANGNGETDLGDQFGYVCYQTYSTVDPFMYGADIPYTSRSEDGRIVIDMSQERAVSLVEKTVALFHQTGVYSVSRDPFAEGQALFCASMLGAAAAYREMEDDFGFLPTPKLDEEQSAYRDLVSDVCSLTAVPVTCLDTEMASAVLEALNAQTWRTVTTAWYEVSLKFKYARDLLSSDMIDLIHDSIYTDFLFAYSLKLSNLGQLMRLLVNDNNTNYMSTAAKFEKSAVKLLGKMYDTLEKNKKG